jgi:predicted dehydrogenase
VPNAVVSRGRLIGGDYLQYVETQYFYPGRDVAVSCISGSMTQRPMVFTHGFEVFLERATLLYSFSTLKGEAVSSPLTLIDGKGEVSQPRLESTDPIDAFVGEIQYAVDSIRQGTAPVALSGEGARAALDLCWKEAESVKTGRIVTLDP